MAPSRVLTELLQALVREFTLAVILNALVWICFRQINGGTTPNEAPAWQDIANQLAQAEIYAIRHQL